LILPIPLVRNPPGNVDLRALHVQDAPSSIPLTWIAQSLSGFDNCGTSLLMMRLDQLSPFLNEIMIPGDIGKPTNYVTLTLLTAVVTLDTPATTPMCVMTQDFLVVRSLGIEVTFPWFPCLDLYSDEQLVNARRFTNDNEEQTSTAESDEDPTLSDSELQITKLMRDETTLEGVTNWDGDDLNASDKFLCHIIHEEQKIQIVHTGHLGGDGVKENP
jgi:hypothetical protein